MRRHFSWTDNKTGRCRTCGKLAVEGRSRHITRRMPPTEKQLKAVRDQRFIKRMVKQAQKFELPFLGVTA